MTEDLRRYPSLGRPDFEEGWPGYPTAGPGYAHTGHATYAYVDVDYQPDHGAPDFVSDHPYSAQPDMSDRGEVGWAGSDETDPGLGAHSWAGPEGAGPDVAGPDWGRPDAAGPDWARPEMAAPGWAGSARVGQLGGIEVAPTEQIAAPGRLIDLAAPRPAPVTHRGERRRRAVVLITAAAAVMIAGGTGYALFRPSSEPVTAGPSTGTSTTLPAAPDAPLDLFPDPSGAPVTSATPSAPTTGPSTAPSSSAPRTAGPSASRTTAPPPAQTTAPIALPDPTVTTRAPSPTVTTTTPTPSAPAALTAAYSAETVGEDVVGTVRVNNPGTVAVSGWTVRLTVPGGAPVTIVGGSATVSQSGAAVTFQPAGGSATVAAGGSVTFRFSVAGPLDGQPSGCSIDGNACS